MGEKNWHFIGGATKVSRSRSCCSKWLRTGRWISNSPPFAVHSFMRLLTPAAKRPLVWVTIAAAYGRSACIHHGLDRARYITIGTTEYHNILLPLTLHHNYYYRYCYCNNVTFIVGNRCAPRPVRKSRFVHVLRKEHYVRLGEVSGLHMYCLIIRLQLCTMYLKLSYEPVHWYGDQAVHGCCHRNALNVWYDLTHPWSQDPR